MAIHIKTSFLIDLEREIEAGVPGLALAWLRAERGRRDRSIIVSPISISEFLEGCAEPDKGFELLGHFTPLPIGYAQAKRCAEVQRKASKRGSRFGENDAWQIAIADVATASIVGRDSKAFTHLGARYEQFG